MCFLVRVKEAEELQQKEAEEEKQALAAEEAKKQAGHQAYAQPSSPAAALIATSVAADIAPGCLCLFSSLGLWGRPGPDYRGRVVSYTRQRDIRTVRWQPAYADVAIIVLMDDVA